VRVEGGAGYELRVRTSGWIEVDRDGLLPTERAELAEGGHVLALSLRPERGRPREISFTARPHGVPVWIDGTRGARRLRPGEVRVATEGLRPRALPFLVPDVEELDGPFAPPPPGASGVSLWLVPSRDARADAPLDRQARESLEALGYLR
jgi:hypothetical protein